MRGVWITALRVTAVALMTLVFVPPAFAAPLSGAADAVEATGSAALTATQNQEPNNIVDFGFEPAVLEVNVGDSIAWTNTGGRPHTVTDRGGTFDTDAIAPGQNGTVEFTAPGIYQFFCRINPGKMNGVIVVQPGAEPSGTNRVQAIDDAREGKQLSFEPAELTVTAGSTVQFANVGGKPHTMTAEDGSFDTGEVAPGTEGGRFAGNAVTFTAPGPGTYAFVCSVHPAAMTGVLTVVEGNAPPAEPADGGGEQAAPPAPPPDAPATAEIAMADFSFDPAEVSVAPGGTVTWTNSGQAPHTATLDDVDLDTGNVAPGAQGTLTAPQEPGSYSYKCTLHPGQMQAVLVVVAPGAADPTGADVPPLAVGGAAAADPAGAEGSRGLSLVILLAAVVGAFLGGLGLTMLMRSRRRPGPPPPPSQAGQPMM